MCLAGKFQTDKEIMIVLALDKEPIKIKGDVKEIILEDIIDEELLTEIKSELD